MAKQVQIRGDTASNLNANVPVQREIGFDYTNYRLRLGDGLTSGGIIVPNYKDTVNNTYCYADAGGSANAITINLTPAATAYTKGMAIKFVASANNTGAVTISLNGMTAKNLLKRAAGTIGALAANDILSGGIYTAEYDGTQFQILATEAGAAIISVSQGDINTSTGTGTIGTYTSGASPSTRFMVSGVGADFSSSYVSGRSTGFFVNSGGSAVTALIDSTLYTLPGGQYGFAEQYRVTFSGSTGTVGWQQRYITASPPYDLGDGETGGFIFVLLNGAGEVVMHYAADTPPWAYNGPTDITAQYRCPKTHKKFRKVMAARSLEEIMDGAKINYELQEITHAIKNADMDLIPHPFGTVPPGHTVVLLDPMDTRLQKLIEYQNAGGGDDVVAALTSGKIFADSAPLDKRKGPQGVMQAKLRYKYSGG